MAKLRQIVRALELEQRFSKDEILALYFALAPYGGNLEGIRAASLAYFGKEPKRLTIARSGPARRFAAIAGSTASGPCARDGAPRPRPRARPRGRRRRADRGRGGSGQSRASSPRSANLSRHWRRMRPRRLGAVRRTPPFCG